MIYKLAEYIEDLAKIAKNGMPTGTSTGWNTLDEYYRIQRGMMTIVTGIPAMGKSEVVDGIFVNLAHNEGWKFAVYSPENFPIALHTIKLVEKYVGRGYAYISPKIRKMAHEWVNEHFHFIYPKDSESSLPFILDYVLEAKELYGCDGYILDPWNEIESSRPSSLTETEYVSQSLSKIRRFSRENKLAAWIVAHPTKLRKNDDGSYDPPTPYDIAGSAHWYNKADFCLTVHRYDMGTNCATIIIKKVKFKHLGKLGEVTFSYDWKSGRFLELDCMGGIIEHPALGEEDLPQWK